MIVNAFDHVIEKVQIVIISADRAAVVFQDVVFGAIVKIGKVRRKADVNSHKGFFGLGQPLDKEIRRLGFISCNVVAEGMKLLNRFEIQIFVAMDLTESAIFHKRGREVPRDGGGCHQKAVIICGQEIMKGWNVSIWIGTESLPVKFIVKPA